jgi:DNA-binding transcriptional regulator YhcF (GntR family)
MTNPPAAIGLDLVDVSIDRDAEVPIGVQLAWALRTRIQDGRFKPGQRLPGLRELAETTGVNVNTVRAVYQRLDQEGLIDSQQGNGTFVTPIRRRQSDVTAIAATAAHAAHETGVDPREVAAALYVSPESPVTRTEDAVSRRRILRTQIAVLEGAIGEIETEHPGIAPAPTATRRAIGPALLGTVALEQVRDQLVRRLGTLQGAVDDQAHPREPAGEDTTTVSPARARRAKKGKAPAKRGPARRRPAATRPATAES